MNNGLTSPTNIQLISPGSKRSLEEDFDPHGFRDVKRAFPNGNMHQVPGGVGNEIMMVPENMIGLIIGKGGEQITRLQTESGCKIQLDKESNGLPERCCTLTGAPTSIAQAKVMIEGILANEGKGRGGGGGGGMGNFGGGGGGGGGGSSYEMLIPGHKVSHIIGKGGEIIKRIQEETGARMRVIQENESPADEKPLRITGSEESIEHAKQRVIEILEAEQDWAKTGGPRGGGRGRGGRGGFGGRGGGGRGGGGSGWPSGDRYGGGGETTEYVSVPANKTGLVIGKGGDTIQGISQQSGAHCEVDRNAPPDAPEKTFIIRGSPESVERARNMIYEKVGRQGGGGGYDQPRREYGQPQHHGGYGQQGEPAINPTTGQPDYSAQWAEYYRSAGMQKEAEMIEVSQGGGGGMVQVAQNGGGAGAGQPDYSAQWIEYYRSIGKHKEAEAIEAQMRAKGGSVQPSYPQPGAAQPGYGAPAGYYQQPQPTYQQPGYPGY